MPRIGMNPSRGRKTGYSPPRVTLAMLTYIPEEAGYFEHRFDVLKLSIASLLAHTPQPFDLLIFDNASCPPVVDYLRGLRGEGLIQYLILSDRNIGKMGALKIIANAAPGEILAYTDDDVFFLPGWLETHLNIFDTFPNVGLVTGYYIRAHTGYALESTLKFAKQPDVKMQRGQMLEQKWEQHFIDNMGRTWEKYREETHGLEDIALTYRGIEVFASAGHHQFVAARKILLKAFPDDWSHELMGQMRELETALDSMGHLRLATRQPVTRLLGNELSSEMVEEARSYGLSARGVQHKPSSAGSRLLHNSLVRRAARYIYNQMYKIINT